MIIQSKKTGDQHEISKEQWARLQKDGASHKYSVVSDLPLRSAKKIIIPEIVTEIKKEIRKPKQKYGRKNIITKAPKDND